MDYEAFTERTTEGSKWFQRILICAILLGFVIFIIVVTWVELYGGGISFDDGLLGIHATYMVFYLLIVHPLSSLIYRLLSSTIKYNVQILHAGIHLIAGIGTSIGLGAIIYLHSEHDPPEHFHSLHSWLGIAAFSVFVMQFFAGVISFLLKIPTRGCRDWALPVHRAIGLLLLILTAGSALTGLFNVGILQKYSETAENQASLASEILLNTSAVLVILYAFIMGYLMTEHYFRRPIYSEHERLLTRSELAKVYSASGMP